ncbi:MAG TPA: hypothetical protein VHJ69_05000 [Gemmatimonadales bacterium]|nr:hypothetical protein [Gemmatimonadales bacterium]
MAALTPAVGSQQSLFGQRWTSTDVRLDGAQARNLTRAGEYGAGLHTLSMEAIREFEVNANVYDVTQGRQGGGTISAATRSGTNRLAGTVFGYYRSDGLSASTDFLGRGRDVRDFTAVQWGPSVGRAYRTRPGALLPRVRPAGRQRTALHRSLGHRARHRRSHAPGARQPGQRGRRLSP